MTEELQDMNDVRDRLSGVRTAMVTTADERGTLSSRPVTKQEIDGAGNVWFLVDGSAAWVEPADGSPINAAFVDGEDSWVSFSGMVAWCETGPGSKS